MGLFPIRRWGDERLRAVTSPAAPQTSIRPVLNQLAEAGVKRSWKGYFWRTNFRQLQGLEPSFSHLQVAEMGWLRSFGVIAGACLLGGRCLPCLVRQVSVRCDFRAHILCERQGGQQLRFGIEVGAGCRDKCITELAKWRSDRSGSLWWDLAWLRHRRVVSIRNSAVASFRARDSASDLRSCFGSYYAVSGRAFHGRARIGQVRRQPIASRSAEWAARASSAPRRRRTAYAGFVAPLPSPPCRSGKPRLMSPFRSNRNYRRW